MEGFVGDSDDEVEFEERREPFERHPTKKSRPNPKRGRRSTGPTIIIEHASIAPEEARVGLKRTFGQPIWFTRESWEATKKAVDDAYVKFSGPKVESDQDRAARLEAEATREIETRMGHRNRLDYP